jgi:hypothetical protein
LAAISFTAPPIFSTHFIDNAIDGSKECASLLGNDVCCWVIVVILREFHRALFALLDGKDPERFCMSELRSRDNASKSEEHAVSPCGIEHGAEYSRSEAQNDGIDHFREGRPLFGQSGEENRK